MSAAWHWPLLLAVALPGLPDAVRQGTLVRLQVEPGSQVQVDDRPVRVDAQGRFAFGVARDQSAPVRLRLVGPDGVARVVDLPVQARDWDIERVNGVPQATVDPPPAIAARIAREQAAVSEARRADEARSDFSQPFQWPLQGRISGVFGSQRIYNGSPRSPHSGLDIAAPTGTPVRAPAAGVVTLAEPDLYLTGGTLLIDHGHGVSSNFLHLSRLDVRVGERVEQGQVIGAVGATGRATGPHLHWGMNWFEVRVDPRELPPAPEAPR